jgi:cell wall assembly regulator SMI1
MPHDSLHRITQWLATHAPRILHESLNPGATDEQLTALEAAVGKLLPEDFKALYRWHDGLNEEADNLGSLMYGMDFLPLAKVKSTYHYLAQDTILAPLRYTSPELRADNALNPHWLRVGGGPRTWLSLDLDPTIAGTYGQVIFLDDEEETAFIVAESVATLLADFARDLQQGHYFLNTDALEEDNIEFLDTDPSIDLVNWFKAARWQAHNR